MEVGEGNVDESCLETSLPTDVSLSQDDASEMDDVLKSNENFATNKIKNPGFFTSPIFSRNYEGCDDVSLFKEKKMRNELLKMNVLVKEKSLKIDALKSEYFQKIEKLESKLSETMRENGLLKMQMEMERGELERIKAELIKKLNNIESNQGHLKIASTEIQRAMQAPGISEDQYHQLLSTDHDRLCLTDFISKHLYERQRDSVKVTEVARSSLKVKQDQLHQTKLTIDSLKDELDQERQMRVEVEVRLERTAKEVQALRTKIITDDFKSNNYDALEKEKYELEIQFADVSKQKNHLDNHLSSVSKQLSECQNEMTSLKQGNSLLTTDKTYLSQVADKLNSKVTYLEGRCHHLDVQNDKYKGAREELYEKYIASRDQYKRDYDERLRGELERLARQMEEDVRRLKQANKEVSEREIRGLREARDMAVVEKREAQAAEKEVSKEYQLLLLDFRQKQMWGEGQASDLQNDLKVRSFEHQKLQVLLEETLNNLKESQLSYDKLQKKMDVLTREYYTMQVAFEKRNVELETLVKFKEAQMTATKEDFAINEGGMELKEEIHLLKNNIRDLETERGSMLLEKRSMSADLQKLLLQNEEMAQLRRVIESSKRNSKSKQVSPNKVANPASRITFQRPIS